MNLYYNKTGYTIEFTKVMHYNDTWYPINVGIKGEKYYVYLPYYSMVYTSL